MTQRPINIRDIMDEGLFMRMVQEKYVKVVEHPYPAVRRGRERDTYGHKLYIANYTKAAQWDKVWNEVTTQCRGIIYWGDGEIAARPFPKFFNYGEDTKVVAEQTGPLNVYEKMDGSLGIIYPAGIGAGVEQFAVATRGSFTSDQAVKATNMLHSFIALQPHWQKTYEWMVRNPGVTPLVEIIYPSNRIVVNYGNAAKLVLLAAIDNTTGKTLPHDSLSWWGGEVVKTHEYSSIEEVLAVDRPNAEGFVLHYPESELRVKVKHDEYVRLHKLITGVSERTIWEMLMNGLGIGSLIEAVPDEFYTWVDEVSTRLLYAFDKLHQAYVEEFERIDPELSRKDFAMFVNKNCEGSSKSAMFLLLDGKSIESIVWRELKPDADKTMEGVDA